MNPRSIAALLTPILLTACVTTGKLPDTLATDTLATADIVTAAGLPAGKAVITAAGDKLSLSLSLSGLHAGEHGLHLHAAGHCDGPAFTSAGSHLNPSGHQHGLHNPAGPHLGDLPNLVVTADGSATALIPLTGVRAELAPILFDADGTAIVVHAGPDDYLTDPSGNSGSRIACGVFSAGG